MEEASRHKLLLLCDGRGEILGTDGVNSLFVKQTQHQHKYHSIKLSSRSSQHVYEAVIV